MLNNPQEFEDLIHFGPGLDLVLVLLLAHRTQVVRHQVRRLLPPGRNLLAADALAAAGVGDDDAVSDDALTCCQLRAVRPRGHRPVIGDAELLVLVVLVTVVSRPLVLAVPAEPFTVDTDADG